MNVLRPLLTLLLAVFLTVVPAKAQEIRAAPEYPALPELLVDVPTGWATAGGIVADVHGAADRTTLLTHLSRHAAESAPRLASELGLPLGSRIDVYVAESEGQFHALQPGAAPDWADGTAYPLPGKIFLRRPGIRPAGAAPLEQVLDHELVHVLVGRAFAPHQPPRWLQEGLARVYAGEHSPDTIRELSRGMLERELYTLEALDRGFPRDAAGAKLAYAQSSDLIAFLRAEYGEDAVRTLTREMAAGAGIHRAVRSATGLWLPELDKQWRDRIDRGPAPLWLTGFLAEDGFWFLTGALAVVALGVAFRRRRRQLADYRREEEERDALIWSLLRPRADLPGSDVIH
ncbi:MAG: hypothetical protein EP330_26870 [Deltaproteobacteria bacterium]|nr:MAG: hypothetical protein EP330_26870 [Deltaproteobacteria bacterium]